jgi:hypothetical protein
MNSDYAAARLHLERAFDYLRGNDDISRNAREAIDLLIEAVAAGQYNQPPAQLLRFPAKAGQG